jgi:hypothetical protein|tara:strand:- start:51 stop:335 length:285 start_codon:yes stop_codon:yes gene_type:complete
MIVKIYKDYKMPTQSGRANINEWILEFMSVDDRFQEQIMGWTGSENMYPNEVKLRFEDKNQAITFAKKNKLDFFIKEPVEVKQTIKSYIDNYLK